MTFVEELYAEMATNDSHLAHLQQAEHPRYAVAVVLNKDMGPDEILQEVRSISWDHERQVLMIEPE